MSMRLRKRRSSAHRRTRAAHSPASSSAGVVAQPRSSRLRAIASQSRRASRSWMDRRAMADPRAPGGERQAWRRGARGAKSRPVAHVVIAGAGPAGASLAYLLARRGLGVTLLERQTDFAREFRGEGLMPSGAEALGAMGLGPALDALPQTQIEALDVFRRARRLLRVRPEDLGAPGPRVVSQPALLEMLVGEAGRFPGFRLERGVTVRDLVREGERRS